MFIEASLYSSKPPLAMAATLHAPLSLDILPDEGRSTLRRQGSLTPGSSSPKVDWRASAGLGGGKGGGQGGNTIRRSLSVGSALSDFLGSISSRKSLEENSSMRRSGSKGCLESLEAGNNAKAVLDGEDSWGRFEEDREWNFATLENTLRPGGMLHRDTFPSTQFLSQEWQSLGKASKDSLPRPGNGTRAQLKRSNSTSHKITTQKKSIVVEQAQESFDSLKDRLESSLKMQPECSYAPARPPTVAKVLPVASDVTLPQPCKDTGVVSFAKDVSGLNLSALPRSLKRRKNKEKNLTGSRSCAMSNAFSAFVYIIRSMHGHALEMQEDHVVSLVTPMQREIDLSFAWLFQQVFATTPDYMLSIMVLLAEFSVHSLGEDMALAAAMAMANPKAQTSNGVAPLVKEGVAAGLIKELNRRQKAAKLEGSTDGSAFNETLSGLANGSGLVNSKVTAAEEMAMQALLAETMKELETNAGWQPPPQVDREVAKKFVAPVQVTASPDNYPCFDRTELEYQHAISLQPTNVMLLSNYAQFLYVVRHDNNRAEEYFHRAIGEDPADAEVLGRFATFLWLARGDKDTADRAFRAAAALDPTNPYHAGNYSHFLWHSEDSKYPKCPDTCYVGNA